MSALAAFLEARLVEEEDAARHALHGDIHYLPSVVCMCGRRTYFGVANASRALAQVASMRAIAETADPKLPDKDTGSFALRQLAAMYADHPDYREEWRA